MSGAALPSNLAVWKSVVGANPAAGNDFSQTVPAGKWWLLKSVSVPCVQGLTQTPQPILVIDDGTNVLFEMAGSTAVQAASTTVQYTWAADVPALTGLLGSGANVHAMAPLPADFLLPAGYRIRSVTLGIGANTDIGPPIFYVAELG